MRALDARVLRVIDDGVVDPARPQLPDARRRPGAEDVEIAELNGLGRARRGTRRLEAGLLTVVAERALERAPVAGSPIDDAERARHDAVAAAVADVRLDEHAA